MGSGRLGVTTCHKALFWSSDYLDRFPSVTYCFCTVIRFHTALDTVMWFHTAIRYSVARHVPVFIPSIII